MLQNLSDLMEKAWLTTTNMRLLMFFTYPIRVFTFLAAKHDHGWVRDAVPGPTEVAQ